MQVRVIARCTPTLGMVSEYWCKGVEDVTWPMNTIKAGMFCRDVVGGLIAESRNMMVEKVLAIEEKQGNWTANSAIFWLDDDVIVSPGVLHQLNYHDRDIVTGVYFLKCEHPEPLIFPTLGGGTPRYEPAADNEQKSMEAWMGSMGLSLVRTSVFRRMRDELNLPLDRNGNPEWYRTTIGRPDHLITEDGVLDKGGTEDSYFAANAHKLGYSMLVDLTKHAFGFHYNSKLNRAYPEAQWKQAQANEPVKWVQPDGSEITWK